MPTIKKASTNNRSESASDATAKVASSSKKRQQNVPMFNDPNKKRKGSTGFDEIDSLFSEKKKLDKKEKQEATIKKRKHPSSDKIWKEVGSTASSQPKHGIKISKQSVLEEKFSKASSSWVDDGLGGKFNREGYTGRVEDGVKVFKAHVLNKPGFGQSKDCPFDCDCCFI
ncbi:protein of unknown function DUF1764 containing protein [Nitzschia inconspicua]|uniref:Uncharacterized protein n=1 Tax=Nitzschia inconspicua TaxID=303405 RepID=A0A9K3KID8_9STRA|nr:protein of unknown function DUF1764 containing protein [Nitzschia inconspicua]